MTKKEKRTAAIVILVLAIIAMIFGYVVTKNKAAEKSAEPVKTQVTAEVAVERKAQEVPAASTVVAPRKKAAAATTNAPVITNTDDYAYDATLNMSASEIGELTTVTNEGEDADNLDANVVVAPGYNTPDEKEEKRQEEKEQIKAEEEAPVDSSNDAVVVVPDVEEDAVKDLVDEETNEAIDDTEEAVEDHVVENRRTCDHDDDSHRHASMELGGYTYIFCDKIEEIIVEGTTQYNPWARCHVETEEEFYAAQAAAQGTEETEENAEEVADVEEAEEVEETTETMESATEEIVEENVELEEAEEVESEDTVSGNEI